MADFGAPVAQNVDVSPQKGLQTISSLLSLKSQQLGIQQQQQGLQGQAAQVQQEQLKAGEQQGVQNFFQQWDPSAHISSDGTTDVDSALQSHAYQGAGNAKPGIMQSLLDIKNRQLTNKQSLATLNGQLLTQFSQGMGALAKDPDVVSDQADPTTGVNAGRAKVDQFINNFSKLSPDAQRVAQIYGPVTQHAPQGKLSDGIQAIQMQGQDVGGQQAQQNPQTVSVQRGNVTSFGTAPKSTGIPTFNGPNVSMGVAPGVVSGPNQQLVRIGDNGQSATPLTTPAGPAAPQTPGQLPAIARPGPNAPAQQQAQYAEQNKNNMAAVTNANAITTDPQNNPQATRYRNGEILRLVDSGPATGPGKDIWNHIASQFPGGAGDAYQKIGHYLAQNTIAGLNTMGVPNTNAGQETSGAATGNVQQNPGAIKEITKVNDAVNSARMKYIQGLQKVTQNQSNFDSVPAYQQAFGQNFDINLFRLEDAQRRGDKSEVDTIVQKLGPQGLKALGQKKRIIDSLTNNGSLPQ